MPQKCHFGDVASLNNCRLWQLGHYISEWVNFLEDRLFEFDEHVVVIVLKKKFPKVVLSLVKLNLYVYVATK